MAGRIRSIKPEILEDEKAAGLTDSAWRLWVSTWVIADDYGGFRASVPGLRGAIFWHPNHARKDIEKLLVELESKGLIHRYEVDGQLYSAITKWGRHQKVQHPGKPRIPKPPPQIHEDYREPHESLTPDHDHDHDHDHITQLDLPTDLDLLTGEDLQRALRDSYKFYPLKVEKKEGLRKASTLIKTAADLAAFRSACEAMGKAWKGHDLQFCKGFSVFVNGESWRANADELLPFPRKPQRATPSGSSREQDYNK